MLTVLIAGSSPLLAQKLQSTFKNETQKSVDQKLSASVTQLPRGWEKDGKFQNYEIGIDKSFKNNGLTSAYIKFTGGKADASAGLRQGFNSEDYRGKRLRMSAWMKTKEVDSANLWMRFDSNQRMLGFDNMSKRAVKGTTDWKKYEITMDVPQYTVHITFGFSVTGKGQAWADDFRFEVVGNDVPSTNMLSPEEMNKENKSSFLSPAAPKMPINLDFEQGINSAKKVIAVDSKILDTYTGEYLHPDGKKPRITRKGSKLIVTQLTGEKFEILPFSINGFFREDRPQERFVFISNEKGQITHYVSQIKMWHALIVKKIK